jgi:TPR repeat protein
MSSSTWDSGVLKAKAWIKTTTRRCDGIERQQTNNLVMHRSTWDWCLIKAKAWINTMKNLLKWYEKAADLGEVVAQFCKFSMGLASDIGSGSLKSYWGALQHYLKAANKGKI